MTQKKFFKIIDYIITKGKGVTVEYTGITNLPIDYVHIFSQSNKEKEELLSIIEQLGKIVERPKTGITYQLDKPYPTDAGKLILVNIRFPDSARPQRGAPDFRVDNFEKFKKQILGKENVNLIKRPDYEMVEIWDNQKDVLVYFPNEPLTTTLDLQ